MVTYVNNLSPDTAYSNYPNDTTIDNMLTQLNNDTAPDVFDIFNVSMVNASMYNTTTIQVRQLKLDILTALDAQSAASVALSSASHTITTAPENLATSLALAIQTKGDLEELSITLDPLLTAGKNLWMEAYCGEIGVEYHTFKSTWCDLLATAFSFVALACFTVGILGWVIFFLTKILEKRLPHPRHAAGEHFNGETELQSHQRQQHVQQAHHDPEQGGW